MAEDYDSRLSTMEAWYRTLIGSGPGETEHAFLTDYTPHADYLNALSGRIIDIGGGAGVAARFLKPDVEYVVVDPSEIWKSAEWSVFAREFRGSGPVPRFVGAEGEALPFGDREFDTALSFWALNHVRDPGACMAEMIRVMKPGGTARLVIDDVEPSWVDLIADGSARIRARLAGSYYPAKIQRPLLSALRAKLSGKWPIQPDHLRIAEAELLGWIGDRMTVGSRQWLADSLIYDLVKR